MRRVQRVVVALGAVALSLALAALAGVPALTILSEGPLALGVLVWPAALGLALLLVALQHQGFVFHWRQQSTKISLDEVGLFAGLLVLPATHVVLATALASLLNQLLHKRAPDKAAFNVAQYTTAAFASAGVTALLAALVGVPPLWAAVPAPTIFYALTAWQVSWLFARREGTSTARVLTQRFGRFVLIGSALGTSLGLVVVALYALHPFAVLAAVPVFLYLRRFGRLSEWADDEIKTHRLVATVSAEVAGRADLDRVADRILTTCHELFDCAEASLVLARDANGRPRVWSRSFVKCEGHAGVAAEIRGSEGAMLGSLSIFPQPGQAGYGEREQQLLRTVGAAAAAAAANAEALRAAEELNGELAEREERIRALFDAQKTLEEELRRSMAQQHETIKRLENMNRELEQFTLWTTHDMREPLRSIGTIAGFLHEDIGSIGPEEARDMARRISEGAERLKERVKALHAFSLIVQRDDEFEDVDLQRVMEHVVSGLEAKIAEKGATVVFPRGRFPIVRAQPHRLDQVFANLVENALKYGRPEGATVELGFQETAHEWRFFVKDDGPGVPAGYHERIFQLFQRGPKNIEGGSGAGLAIVKRIAEQHGGRAWVESCEGQGACFVVALPRPAPLLLVSKAF